MSWEEKKKKVLDDFGVVFCSFYLLWLGSYIQIEIVLLGPLVFNYLHCQRLSKTDECLKPYVCVSYLSSSTLQLTCSVTWRTARYMLGFWGPCAIRHLAHTRLRCEQPSHLGPMTLQTPWCWRYQQWEKMLYGFCGKKFSSRRITIQSLGNREQGHVICSRKSHIFNKVLLPCF